MRSIFARSRWARSIWPCSACVGWFAMLRSCGEPIYRDLEYSSIQVYFSFLAYSRKALARAALDAAKGEEPAEAPAAMVAGFRR